MSTSSVLSLDAFRDERDARLGLALALARPDSDRSQLLHRIWDALQFVPADRGAVVWIDEYGPGLVHTHCVLDLQSDRPRRAVALEPLRRAWSRGIPGVIDEPDLTSRGDEIFAEGPRSFAAVSLGSDGLRAWFLVLDSRRIREPIHGVRADSLMFIAGECASIVIRADLDEEGSSGVGSGANGEVPGRRSTVPAGFVGSRVLGDLTEAEALYGAGNPGATRRVAHRFLLTRMLGSLVQDDFSYDAEAMAGQIGYLRSELESFDVPAARRGVWSGVIDAVEIGDHPAASAGILDLARDAEEEGHFRGARELGVFAYDFARAGGSARQGAEAARLLGRVCRRLGSWDESETWYEVGRGVAREGGLWRTEALALDGLGNTHRDRGRLPSARDCYLEVLEIGTSHEDGEILAKAHHSLAVVEKHSGRTDEAIRHGWAAVQAFKEPAAFYRALADLGDIFIRCGEYESAAQALTVVAGATDIPELRVPARELRGHVAALLGRREEFAEWIRGVELEGMNVAVRAEILYTRGLSYLALSDLESAQRWLREAMEYARTHGVSRVLIQAEEALDTASTREWGSLFAPELPHPAKETMSEVRAPMAEMAVAGSI